MVELGAARHAGRLGDVGGAEMRVPLLAQHLDRGIEDAHAHVAAALGLGAAGAVGAPLLLRHTRTLYEALVRQFGQGHAH